MAPLSAPGLVKTGLTWGFVMISLGVSTGLLWNVYLHNVPTWGMDHTEWSYFEDAAWFYTVNQTSGPGVPGMGLTKYGFGVWGWCEWGSSLASETGYGICHGGGAWSINGSAPTNDSVRDLHLPSVIDKGLFPVGVLLVIPLIISTLLVVAHLLTVRYPHQDQPPLFPKSKAKTPIELSKNFRCKVACLLRNFWVGFILWVISTKFLLPPFIIALVAEADHMSSNGVTYHQEVGQGAWSCIVVICLELFALILLWTFDMWSGGVPKDVKNVKV